MGREVRRVPKDWEHPKKDTGRYQPLMSREFLASTLDEWDSNFEAAKNGTSKYYETVEEFLKDYGGSRPNESEYMPDFGDTATYYCMYEDTSEGTPISPAFETPEELAHWLADTNASSFANRTASYVAWLETINMGWALSAVFTPQTGIISGVEYAGAQSK
jgi:hypothetical protein